MRKLLNKLQLSSCFEKNLQHCYLYAKNEPTANLTIQMMDHLLPNVYKEKKCNSIQIINNDNFCALIMTCHLILSDCSPLVSLIFNLCLLKKSNNKWEQLLFYFYKVRLFKEGLVILSLSF